MRTAPKFRQQGVARAVLEAIIASAKQLGLKRLNLETGSMLAFEPARIMYERFGFTQCEPFADYSVDSNSVYMTKSIR